MTKQTLYERVLYLYSRQGDDFLSVRQQKGADCTVNQAWAELANSKTYRDSALDFTELDMRLGSTYMAFEKNVDGVTVGLITLSFAPNAFDAWFIRTVLDNGSISFHQEETISKFSDLVINNVLGSDTAKAEGTELAHKVTEVFESTIKNAARVDKWEQEGKKVFIEHVSFFTSRNITIQAVLPAFPCKSSNYEKVALMQPDMGEELALRRVIEFVQKVEQIYPPGLRFFVVSDGHVFSDCINVDDDVVDTYTNELIALYEKIKPENFCGILFRGLNDCFESPLKAYAMDILAQTEVDHHLKTKLDELTEVNRKILMLGCDDNADLIREQIKTPGHPRLFLYRGFNRFMHEDLINTPTAIKLSGKKFKKLVSQVAYEMIRRNDAYLNLVELVFPFHLRLSIHAHPNTGPKFGIRLLDPETCCAVNHDQGEEEKLLHIPTPWHNAIFDVAGRDKLIVSSAKLAEVYLKGGYSGGWNKDRRCYRFAPVELS